jgi:predicted  nucleic acid-binding Zn-ribbon protein
VPSPSLTLLLEVQERDLVLDRLAYRLRELPERAALKQAEHHLAGLLARGAALDSERVELAGRQQSLEEQIASIGSRIALIEARLRSASAGSFRDQQAMAAEIESLARQRREIEDREIDIMEQLEPIEKALAALAEEESAAAAMLEETREALELAERLLAEERAAAEGERAPLAAKLPSDLALSYERLREKLGGVGAARLVDGVCSGCHLRLPASERERLLHAEEGVVSYCEQCGRILVP